MKKIILFLIIIATLFSFTSVYAARRSIDDGALTRTTDNTNTTTDDATCESMLGSVNQNGTLAYYIQKGLEITRIAGVAICIVLSAIDFFKALFSEAKDLKAPFNTSIKRLIWAIVIFFVPVLTNVLLEFLDINTSTCGIA